MPVATRSQLHQEHNAPRNKSFTDIKPPRDRLKEPQIRSSHNDLKKKMEALTLFYQRQQKDSMLSRKGATASVDLPFSSIKDEKSTKPLAPSCNARLSSRNYSSLPTMPQRSINEAKENIAAASNRIFGGSTVKPKKLHELDPCKINVFVRLRPTSKKEKEEGSRCCVKIVNMRDIYLTEFLTENDYLRLKRVRGRHFTFDASFPDSTSQEEVYSTTTSNLVEAVLQGKNGSVFCYGATGAGKTYTMLGTMENPGVMVLAIKDLFAQIRQRSHDGNHTVHLSYLEVYNDSVRDLLSPGRALVLREDKQGIVAAGLTQYRAYSTDEVMALLQRGNLNRTTEPTRANETSSRSHAILQVVTEYKVKDSASMHVVNRIGKLSLIDLAGSERALATDQRSLRSFEGANINKSLLALSSCINALVEGKKHIPYRNSKLTQLLKDSLGGPCNTVMIANISPSNLSFAETQNTLHWADRAKEIRTKGNEVNEEIQLDFESEGDRHKVTEELQKENQELKKALKGLEEEMRRMKKEHALEVKQRDDIIYALSKKEGSSRFKSPVQENKKRSFWDIASGNSPSVQANARKVRSNIGSDNFVPPSMLLQPGFASKRHEPFK